MRLTRRRVLKGLLGVALAGLFASLYAFLVEPSLRLRVRRWRVRSAQWSGGPLRIAVISDLHVCEPYQPLSRLARVVRRVNALGADIVLYLGDLNASHPFVSARVPIAESAARLAALRAPLGVYTVLGNHDWWDDAAAQARRDGPCEVAEIFAAHGLPVIENDALRIARSEGDFWLAGLGSRLAFPINGRVFDGRDDMAATVAALTDDAPAVLMVHEPDAFPEVPPRFALTLAGHTHGGQVRLFGYSPKVPSKYGNRYAYGHIHEDGRDLVVSGGIGCSILPVRLGVVPEITVVELHA